MGEIIIKFPTRSRPEKFKQVLQEHIDYLSGNRPVRFIITVDEDDSTMNTPEMRDWLDTRDADVHYHYGHSRNKIEACNADLESVADDSIVILTSDDMRPELKGYDELVAQLFETNFPDYFGAITFHDGLRKPNDPLMTLPVLGMPLIRAIGHIYYPGYESLYADNELTQVTAGLNALIMSPTCIIRHEWVPGHHPEADEMHQQQEADEVYARDKAVFDRREAEGFDVDKILEKLHAQRSG